MATLNVNGVDLHYTDHGPASAPPLLLLHGFPLDGRMWNHQIDPLAQRFRVLIPDFRGFGQSGLTGPFTIEQLADDAAALLEQLKVQRVALAGLSMGGYVALAFARKYPAALRSLILVDTKAEADSSDAKATRDKTIATVNQQGVKPVADSMIQKLIPEDARKSRPQLVRELMTMMESQRPASVAHALAAMRDRPDQTEMLPSIAVPTLIIVGDKDAITPPEVARRMHEQIPRSQLKIITAAGHMSPMEQPAQVNAAISLSP